MNTQSDPPTIHTRAVRERLEALIEHLRDDVSKVDEPQAECLFETTAEVLEGLVKAFTHYENRSEEAWR